MLLCKHSSEIIVLVAFDMLPLHYYWNLFQQAMNGNDEVMLCNLWP